MDYLASKRFWLLVCGLMVLFLLGSYSGTALAASPDEANYTTQVVRGVVNFTLPADTCSHLPAGVSLSGTGTQFTVITTKVKPDGSKLVVTNGFVIGTAMDSNSSSYHFIYSNQDRNQVPKGNGPIKVNMTDAFTLFGGANDYTVAFNWTWTYTPPESEWPPVHNWVQNMTNGDPLTCDPL